MTNPEKYCMGNRESYELGIMSDEFVTQRILTLNS
jgi:hypothetical protein